MIEGRPDEAAQTHRLEGLEPDNLLAFLALLGLLRALGIARPGWRPRASWTVDALPVRPVLGLGGPQTRAAVAEAAAEGVAELAKDHVFDRPKLAFKPEEARERLAAAACTGSQRGREMACLWSALMSDAAMRDDADIVERTPLCLLDVAKTAFLKNVEAVCQPASCPQQGKTRLSLGEVILLCLFSPWRRRDDTESFRWDPVEDSRHALRWAAPTGVKQGVEHGGNVLAVLGLRSLTVVPGRRGSAVRLHVRGGCREDGGFAFHWPIWEEQASLQAIEAMLASPELQRPNGLVHLGVREVRVTKRFNPNGQKYSNFGPARRLQPLGRAEVSVPKTRDRAKEGP